MKKLLSAVLAVILVIGISSVSFAAEDKITGADKPIDTNYSPNLDGLAPGTVLYYPLTADMFTWASGKTGGAKEPVTSRDISRASVSAVLTGSDTKAVKNIKIDESGLIYEE